MLESSTNGVIDVFFTFKSLPPSPKKYHNKNKNNGIFDHGELHVNLETKIYVSSLSGYTQLQNQPITKEFKNR